MRPGEAPDIARLEAYLRDHVPGAAGALIDVVRACGQTASRAVERGRV